MPLDFHLSVDDHRRGAHDVVAHDFGDILDFGEPHVEVVFGDDLREDLIRCLAFRAARPQNLDFPDCPAGRIESDLAEVVCSRFFDLFHNQVVAARA